MTTKKQVKNKAKASTKIALFRGKKVRKTIHNDEWWFSVIDVIEALTGTDRPRKYWNDLKKKLVDEGYSELSENIGQLKLEAADGKKYNTDCANTESIFRLIQSIPSPKDAQGLTRNKQAAKQGGSVAGTARQDLEKKSGQKVSSPDNYLKTPESQKRLEE